MKKLLIASLITIASHTTFAADTKATTVKADPLFTKATQLYEAKDYPAAFQEMQRLADTGNKQAIFNLGYMTQAGQGTAKDEKKALQYYQDASNKGYGPATFALAQAYHKGTLGLKARMKRPLSLLIFFLGKVSLNMINLLFRNYCLY